MSNLEPRDLGREKGLHTRVGEADAWGSGIATERENRAIGSKPLEKAAAYRTGSGEMHAN
jgi:hypothetical protein